MTLENDNKEDETFVQSLLSTQDPASVVALIQTRDVKETSWVQVLVPHLFDPSTADPSLLVVGTMAQTNPQGFLPPIANSLEDYVARATAPLATTTMSLHISSSLLSVWIQQISRTTMLAVHTKLVKALLQAVTRLGPALWHPALQELTSIWRAEWNHMQQPSGDTASSTTYAQSSIIVLRCAETWMESWHAVGDLAFLPATESTPLPQELFVQLLDTERVMDPLLHLSVLDLFPRYLDKDHVEQQNAMGASMTTANRSTVLSSQIKSWLASPSLIQPILVLLQDPLVSGAALQALTLIWIQCSSDNDDTSAGSMDRLRQIILGYIENDVGTTTVESDRLAVLQAMSRLARYSSEGSSALDDILGNPALRSCWWNVSRISSPALQAAVLNSVAQVLEHLTTTAGVRMYTFLAMDNGCEPGTSTTDWLFHKFAKGPMVELRTAVYGLWSAMANLPTGTTILSTSSLFMTWLLQQTVVQNAPREETSESRVAHFRVLESFHANAKGFLAKDLVNKLERRLALGPHGRTPMSWDVGVLD
eukprot:Nitzschia sp. Nitz4//scaffold369_size34440//17150//18757//NITZ4_007843-RA/size34440-processed-gene-0.15-mRNA-1//1//CDS//3329549368//3154//frame0